MTTVSIINFPGAICPNPVDHTYYVCAQGATCPHCQTTKFPLIQFEAYAPKTDGTFEYLHAVIHSMCEINGRKCWLCGYDADDVAYELYEFELEQQFMSLHFGINCPMCNGSGHTCNSDDVDSHFNSGAPDSDIECPECEGNGVIYK